MATLPSASVVAKSRHWFQFFAALSTGRLLGASSCRRELVAPPILFKASMAASRCLIFPSVVSPSLDCPHPAKEFREIFSGYSGQPDNLEGTKQC
jgi:hypothetical protein